MPSHVLVIAPATSALPAAKHTVERAVTVISATRNVASTFAFFIIIFLSDKKIRAVNALTNMLIFIVASGDNLYLHGNHILS